MKNEFVVRLLEEDIKRRKETLDDMNEKKESFFGVEKVAELRVLIEKQIKEIETAIEILKITWK